MKKVYDNYQNYQKVKANLWGVGFYFLRKGDKEICYLDFLYMQT